MNFEYIAKKKGRKITDLEFKISYKPAIKKPIVPASNLSISNEVLKKESEQLQKTTFKKEKGFKKFPPEQYRLYKRLKELALSKELAALVVDNIPTKELESEIDDFYNSVTQRKNKTTITPHFEDLLYRYTGIRVRRNYKVNSISKKEPTDADPKEASLVKEIDPSYAFCFDTLKKFGVSYADIQALLIQVPLDEIKIFLEKVSKELEENDEPNKANYVIKSFYTAFGSPHIKSSEQEKVQTLGNKLRNRIYTKQEDLNNEGK
ncbi:hypothetical protein Aasi_0906 [Candidatus Amoebophilus asiaticus 5a2]|uniref:Uncharacterized protein n=1 Tax=Amoebophilus asiaticus (strain 5a2) TaxID=452471 RepID=B3ESS1_AMOA5|nr:hypothetical protein Aasi_0906 [Candidatus Amoebophilus asiaticus 5a2]